MTNDKSIHPHSPKKVLDDTCPASVKKPLAKTETPTDVQSHR